MKLCLEPRRLGISPAGSHARYLVVFGTVESPRAALFDLHGRLMAEMIDAEPYVIEGLAKSGAACAMPCSAMTDQVADLDASVSSEVRCYALQAPKVQRDRVAVPD